MTNDEIVAALKSGETVNYGCHGRNMDVVEFIEQLRREGKVFVRDCSTSQETRQEARWAYLNEYTPVQEKALALLESGKYTQGFNRLRTRDETNGDSYCCLGVFAVSITSEDNAPTASYLPIEFVMQLNLHSKDGDIIGGMYSKFPYKTLALANDAKVPHKDIAAFIRAIPESVFTNFKPQTKG